MTSYELVSAILVSPLVPKVVAAVNSVVTGAFAGVATGAFSGMLFNFFYHNCGSNYITEPCRSTTVDSLIGRVCRYRIVNNVILTSGVVAQ